MTNDKNDKNGLHKEISSIFEGVPLPKNKMSRPMSTPEQSAERPAATNPLASRSRPTTEDLPKPGQARPAQQAKPLDMPTSVAMPRKKSGLNGITGRLLKPKPGVSPGRQKAMVLMVPVLAIVFVFAMMNLMGSSPKKSQASEQNPTPGKKIVEGGEIEWKLPEPLPVEMPDPMVERPVEATDPGDEPIAVEPVATRPQVTVRGILISDNPAAVVNGNIVHVGDMVNDVKVMKIESDSVHFEKDGETWTQSVER